MNQKTAIKILLGLFGLVLIFHLSIILKIVPYEITWGGRLKNDAEMYAFESISIVVNLLFYFVLLIKGEYIKPFLSPKIVNGILWVFLALFVLNTVGNIFAKTNFEKFFTLLTLAAVVLIWIVLKGGKESK